MMGQLRIILLLLAGCHTAAALASDGTRCFCYIAKTQETFKFSDLQLLEAQLQAPIGKQDYQCRRLLLDSATGSGLFYLELKSPGAAVVPKPLTVPSSNGEQDENPQKLKGHSSSNLLGLDASALPSSLARCQWIAEVVCHGESAEALIKLLSNQGGIGMEECTGWTLDYLRMNPMGSRASQDLKYNQKTLLCSVAPLIRAPPVLDAKDASDQLILVETTQQGIYLGHIKWRGPQTAWKHQTLWAARPFQYSSAIHPTVAAIVVDLVLDLVSDTGGGSESTITLLDPTCGSGTFLAFALAKNQHVCVEGWDVKIQCVEGTKTNLLHLFGEGIFQSKKCKIRVKDSSVMEQNEKLPLADCVIANLPWGRNTIDYVDQNLRILQSIRPRLKDGAPCVFVHKDEKLSSSKAMRTLGYDVLGEACIPPLDFDLPQQQKGKHKTHGEDTEPTNTTNKAGKHQRVTVARAV